MRKTSTFLILTVSLFFIGGCTRVQQIQRILEKNPDLVFSIIAKNPDRYKRVFAKATAAVQEEKQAKATQEANKQFEEDFKNPKIPLIAASHPVQGDIKAPILIVEYSDFQCPGCREAFTLLEKVKKKYGEKIAYVFKNFPQETHPLAMPAAKRFTAIALQGADKAYKFHDYVFTNQAKLTAGGEKFLDEAARISGADIAKMKVDMNSNRVSRLIDDDIAEAEMYEFDQIPGLVVAGVALTRNISLPIIEDVIARRMPGLKVASE